jgi:hypothetical protein
MNLVVLVRTLGPRIVASPVTYFIIRHAGVALIAGMGARLGGDVYEALKKRALKREEREEDLRRERRETRDEELRREREEERFREREEDLYREYEERLNRRESRRR